MLIVTKWKYHHASLAHPPPLVVVLESYRFIQRNSAAFTMVSLSDRLLIYAVLREPQGYITCYYGAEFLKL